LPYVSPKQSTQAAIRCDKVRKICSNSAYILRTLNVIKRLVG